jgi:cytochrome d ubiquinol oxidase subunit I
MDPLILARLQFAMTTIYHFFFVPLTLGLSILLAVLETLYVRTGNESYKRMTKFWGKLFLINFGMGVVTGIVQEFQFGMNWSSYSTLVGDIFGAPLAFEALLAFFLESVFLGVWIFGWDRLSKGLHAAAIWLVAIGANISALWILIANSFMQQPVGFERAADGTLVLKDFLAVVLNPNLIYMFPHTLLSGLTTAAFFIMGISAYHLARKHDVVAFRKSFQLGAMVAAMGTFLIILNGHSQTQHMVQIQPMKMAATEALWESGDPASFSLFTLGDLRGEKEVFAIRIPKLLSFLAYNQLSGRVEGMNDLQERYTQEFGPGDYTPPPVIPYWSFRVMVGAGMLMAVLSLWALFMVMGDLMERRFTAMRIYGFAIALPYLANTTGWLLTEVGRFPWVVYGQVTLQQGVSPNVTAGMVWVSLIGYLLVYGALIVATVYLMAKHARTGAPKEPVVEPEPVPSLVG